MLLVGLVGFVRELELVRVSFLAFTSDNFCFLVLEFPSLFFLGLLRVLVADGIIYKLNETFPQKKKNKQSWYNSYLKLGVYRLESGKLEEEDKQISYK